MFKKLFKKYLNEEMGRAHPHSLMAAHVMGNGC